MLTSPLRFCVAGLAGLGVLALLVPDVSAQRGAMHRMGGVHPTFRIMTHVPHTMTRFQTTTGFASTHFTRPFDRRRDPFRFTPAVRRDLNRLRRLDPFGFPAVSPFATANPYTQSPISPGGGYLDGGADVMNSLANIIDMQGRLLDAIEQATLDQQPKRDGLRNRRISKDGSDERAQPTTAEQLRQEDRARQLGRARTGPPVTEITSGQALNRLLDELVRQPVAGAAGPNVPLDAAVLAHLNVTTSGNDAHLGLLKDRGNVNWPIALRDLRPTDDSRSLRKHSEALIVAALDQAEKGRVDANIIKALRGDVDRFRILLKQNGPNLTFPTYSDGKRFLSDLDNAIAALSRGDATRYVNGTLTLDPRQIRTVQDVLTFMTHNGLTFAPAVSGEEAAYLAMHRALVAYYDGLRPETSSPR